MVERVLFGKHPDTAEVGLWVSKATKNARTSSNLDDYLVHPLKVAQRPVARIQPIKLVRGAFVNTTTFSNGTKGDNYEWTAHYFHNFGYVPVVLVQLGVKDIENDIWVDGAKINIRPLTKFPYNYNANDPNKTPIAGTYYFSNPPTWEYHVADDTMNWVGSTAMSVYTIYRNSIT